MSQSVGTRRQGIWPGLGRRLAWLMALAAGGTAVAQYAVDRRVNMQVQQTGRLLDVNPNLYGGGFNTARPMSPLMLGNITANGNASRGLSLRSYSPIQDPNTFRAALGSGDLYTFRRDSVDVGDSAYPLGMDLPGRPYYDPSTTAVSPGLLQGLAAPPTGNAIQGYRPTDLRVSTRVEAPRMPVPQFGPREPAPGNPNAPSTFASIFGLQTTPRLTLPQTAEDEAPWLRGLPQESLRRNTGRAGEELGPGGVRAGRRNELATPLDQALRGESLRLGPIDVQQAGTPPWAAAWSGGELRPGPILAEAGGETGIPSGVLAAARAPDTSLLPGHDVYTDMRLALALSHDPQATWFDDMRRAAAVVPAGPGPTAREQVSKDSKQFMDDMLSSPLHTLTGGGSSALNDQMLKAEALLQIGHYYEAADRYDTAHLIDRANPLPLVGKGHALLAAGDYRSAANALLRGLALFPELSRFPLDLRSLMGGGEQIDIRRADILRRLEQKENPELRFLLGYIEYHTGDRQRGLADLEQAARADKTNSIISRYPAMLRGEGVLPPPQMPPENP